MEKSPQTLNLPGVELPQASVLPHADQTSLQLGGRFPSPNIVVASFTRSTTTPEGARAHEVVTNLLRKEKIPFKEVSSLTLTITVAEADVELARQLISSAIRDYQLAAKVVPED